MDNEKTIYKNAQKSLKNIHIEDQTYATLEDLKRSVESKKGFDDQERTMAKKTLVEGAEVTNELSNKAKVVMTLIDKGQDPGVDDRYTG